MEVVSSCPMQTSGFVWQSSNGSFAQTVVVKATFVLEPGHAKLAPPKDWEAIHEQDRFVTDDGQGILLAPTDRVPYKQRVDLMLVGHAHAPGKQAVRSLVTKFVVGDFSKSIEVVCDRGFRSSDDRLLEGPPFTKMALDWSRTAGGPNTTNPVGMRFDAAPDALGLISLPNLQPPKTIITKRADTFSPIGYGPIPATWRERAKRLDHLASGFYPANWNERPLPEHFDYRYFQAAPQDQQIATMRPDELLVLENLHPVHAQLTTRLPGVCPRAVVHRASGEREDVNLVPDTLWIDADRGICCVVWRGSIGLRHSTEAGLIGVTLTEPVTASSPEIVVETLPPGIVSEEELASMTMVAPFGGQPKAPAIPFVGTNNPERLANPVRSNDDGALPFGPSGLSRLPPAPIAMGQITLPVQNPTSAPTPPEIVLPAPTAAPPPAPMPPPPPSISPASTTVQSAWSAEPASGPPTVRERRAAMTIATTNSTSTAASQEAPTTGKRVTFVETHGTMSVGRGPVQLLWFDAENMAGLGRGSSWSTSNFFDGARDVSTTDDREAVFAALATAPRVNARGVDATFAGAMDNAGKFVPPMVLTSGELELPFDELEVLKAAMSTALALITAADEELKAAVSAAKDFVQMPGLSASPAVSAGLTARIREAFVKEKPAWGVEYLDTQLERVLLAGRHYQKREVFGEMCVRCLMWLPGETSELVGYLPAGASKKLPMWKRFRACVMAEVHPAQDQYETSSKTLKVVGLGRLL